MNLANVEVTVGADDHVETRNLPLLDLAPFYAAEPGAKDVLAAELRNAAEEIGFLALINHGLDWSMIEVAAVILQIGRQVVDPYVTQGHIVALNGSIRGPAAQHMTDRGLDIIGGMIAALDVYDGDVRELAGPVKIAALTLAAALISGIFSKNTRKNPSAR